MTKNMLTLPLLVVFAACQPAATPTITERVAPVVEQGLAPLQAAKTTGKWFGPVTVNFDYVAKGSPYDAVANDVRVKFTREGLVSERLAYYDGQRWVCHFLAESPGTFVPEVFVNGKSISKLAPVEVKTPAQADFIRVADDHRSLKTESGKPYWPVGHNLGWRGGADLPSVPESLARMRQNGMNWARIWSCTWDGKNPWWKVAPGQLDQSVFSQWDQITQAASANQVRFQWVLFHHGAVSSLVDANWNDNPWNVAKKGWLTSPKQFFTDPIARALSRNYLRYVVARYGHEPGIYAWELFNEVENTDSGKTGDWAAVEEWHREMSAFIRSLDAYHHPIVTSSDLRPGLSASTDVYQPHGYPSSIAGLVMGAKVLTDKPFFFGEVGLSQQNPPSDSQRQAIRDGIWSAYLSGHSGAAQFWYWDVVQRQNLDDEFKFASSILSSLQPGPKVRTQKVQVEGAIGSDLVLRPGLSWAASTKREFEFPADAGPSAAGQMSSFLQGTGHADMGSSFTFRFISPASGKLELQVDTIAKAGIALQVIVDGRVATELKYGAGDKDIQYGTILAANYGPGAHVIEVKNTGPDWVSISSYRFSGIGQSVEATAAIDGKKFVVRLRKDIDQETPYAIVANARIRPQQAQFIDLSAKTTERVSVSVQGGKIVPSKPLRSRDALLILEVSE